MPQLGRFAQFSGTVLLAYRDRPMLTLAFGSADKAKGIANQTGTLFNLASVTKIFTGVAVAQLAAHGKIDFHATVGTTRFPPRPASAAGC